ncbi:hypothetical protein AMAG_12619 [Allomyces macrogynus ATCC 38327]|uniref:TOG domain-containing protein n=1 Tax=Allomyces macrogynus (strain ATCC 38327) TaxID=578462 RepID=A0A0L0SZG7_ALLM3|nr:hypothetical protein AMAG_12619 [Allomyces macrogynus ATCC 38327]|eukprot:KNE67902.1 hypothetical protein AMAG_12619 [Allomyces macrogynus ATCC 38327]
MDPVAKLLALFGECGGAILDDWIENQILPLIDEQDARVLSPEVVKTMVHLTIHRYATLPKRTRRAPLALYRAMLDASSSDAKMRGSLIEAAVKVVDAAVIRPTGASGKSVHVVPLPSVTYALQWVDEAIRALGKALPPRLFAIHCTLVALTLIHPNATPSTPVRAFGDKFFWHDYPQRKELAPIVVEWIVAEKLGSDATVVLGSLAVLAHLVAGQTVVWNHAWMPLLSKHLMACKVPVPNRVLRAVKPLLRHLPMDEVLQTSEKIFLRSPEVILPFLAVLVTCSAESAVSIKDAVAAAIATQLSSTNDANAALAQTVFVGLWKLGNDAARTALVGKALLVIAKCGTWQQKTHVYASLKQVTLSAADLDTLVKNSKAESNDQVAVAIFELLAQYPDAVDKLLAAWSRVNEKIRKQVFQVFYDAKIDLPAEKLATATDHVALALVLRQNAFDAKRDAKKLAAFLAIKGSAVDAYYVHALNGLMAADGTVLTGDQLHTSLLLVLASPHATLLQHTTHPAVLAALRAHTDAHMRTPHVAPIARKRFLHLLHHLKAEATLVDFVLVAHHPCLPEDMWSSLAFHCHVHLDQWLPAHAKEVVAIVKAALTAEQPWAQQAALRATSTLLWIDADLMPEFAATAQTLIEDTRKSKAAKAKAAENAANAHAPGRSPVAERKGAAAGRPASAGKPAVGKASAKKGAAAPAVAAAPPEPAVPDADHTQLVVDLICAMTKHGSSLDAVITVLVDLLQEIRHTSSIDVTEAWRNVCGSLDPALDNVRVLMAALLVGLPAKGQGVPTASQDEMVSSLLFQVAVKTTSEPMTPVAFLVLHQIMTRVFDASVARTRTNDKVVLNRVLDHVTFFVDVAAQHATLAISPVMPMTTLMHQLIDALTIWKKQAAKAHEALVTLCHACPEPRAEHLEILKNGCMSGKDSVTAACLEASLYVHAEFSTEFRVLILALACHPEYADLAQQVIERHELVLSLDDAPMLFTLSERAPVASCAAACVKALLARDEKATQKVIGNLHVQQFQRYKAIMHVPVEYDQFGMKIEKEVDTVTPRVGLVECLAGVLAHLPTKDVTPALKQWIPLLDDEAHDVHIALVHALRALIQAHKESARECIAVLQAHAKHKSDDVREAMVVLTAQCAQHLSPKDPQLKEIVAIMIAALRTPSESVQVAVAQGLGGLPVDPRTVYPQLMETLFADPKYAVQRGSAYGLAGLIKAHKSLIKEYELVRTIKDRLQQKDLASRQGALLLLETCTLLLGRMFEPWLIQCMPALLALFSDTNAAVRQATGDTARVMMQNISSHAVKLLMPTMMEGLKSDQWRTKKASIELLSSMAYCAPAHLSSALPILIPALLESLADSHLQVSKASREALNTFGSVIHNPEIQVMVPLLMEALVNEAKVVPALHTLAATTFEHYLDPPSLALIAPIVNQGLSARLAESKCAAAQILGNLTSLAPAKELLHYVRNLTPPLLRVLADAVPKTRSMAARTLGVLVRSLGQTTFPTLVGDLFRVLETSTSAVDKSGAAQGLSEVLAALGSEVLTQWMPTILAGLNSNKRDGYLVLLVYLPMTYGPDYTQYIPQVLPSVLAGLSDESEMVRDSALKAAQIVIDMFNATAIDLLLPELIRGVFDPNWRIRQSSVHLLGDMLGRIMGQKVKAPKKDGNDVVGEDGEGAEGEDEEEQPRVTHTHTQQIKMLVEALGVEMYQKTLASLYILRCDASGMVRQTAIGVWRMLVSNTPRQLKDILPVLLQIVLEHLAKERTAEVADEDVSDGEGGYVDDMDDIVDTAAQTLGDIVRKLGDGILDQMMPVLNAQFDASPRGVCRALVHVMRAAGRHNTQGHLELVVGCVSRALSHPNDDVREAGAATFDALYNQVGPTCIDLVLSPMIKDLPDSLRGLQHVMSVRGHVVLPVLLPSLLEKVDEASCQALASLLSVGSLGKKTAGVLDTLLGQYNPHVLPALQALLSHDVDEDELDSLNHILELHRGDHFIGTAQAMAALAPHATPAFKQQWLGWLLAELDTTDADSVPVVFTAMDAIVKSIAKEDLDGYVSTVATSLAKHEGDEPLAVFAQHPRGPAPVLAIVLHALMYGAHKEQAVRALIMVIHRTPAANLKAHVTAMTGPLIRIMGDRISPVVKALILEAVAALLQRVGILLKPFIPQLSRTLLKQLTAGDDARVVARARDAMVALVALHPRPDALITELLDLLNNATDARAQAAIAHVLAAAVPCAKDAAPVRAAVLAMADADAPHAAALAAAYLGKVPTDAGEVLKRLSKGTAARVAYLHSGAAVRSAIVNGLSAPGDTVAAGHGALAAAKVLTEDPADDEVADALVRVVASPAATTPVKQCALVAMSRAAPAFIAEPRRTAAVSATLKLVRDRSVAVKLAAEQALVAVLQLRSGTSGLDEVVEKLDAAQGKLLMDYHRRVLENLQPRSVDEQELVALVWPENAE